MAGPVGRFTPFLDDLVLGVALVVLVLLLDPGLWPWAVLGVLAWFAAKLFIFRAHLRRPAIGVEAMEGGVATALADLRPRGQVDYEGEIWEAVAEAPVRKGERVRVTAV